jgi:hypothetical protein
MKPALATVVEKIRANECPTASEYLALLREAGCAHAEARSLTVDYQRSLAIESAGGDDNLVAVLRSFRIGDAA